MLDLHAVQIEYNVRVASVELNPSREFDSSFGPWHKLTVTYGDYSPILSRVVNSLAKAKAIAANDNEKNMLAHYINSFTTGSIDEHKEGSRFWIRNKVYS